MTKDRPRWSSATTNAPSYRDLIYHSTALQLYGHFLVRALTYIETALHKLTYIKPTFCQRPISLLMARSKLMSAAANITANNATAEI